MSNENNLRSEDKTISFEIDYDDHIETKSYTLSDALYIEGTVIIDVDFMITHGIEEFLDMLSFEMTGTELLMDIHYTPTGVTEDNCIIFLVTGDASEAIKFNE